MRVGKRLVVWLGWLCCVGLLACGEPGINLPPCQTNADCQTREECVAGYCVSTACRSGDKQFCYEGPDGTENVGTCLTGHKTCDGQDWTGCKEQVLPVAEICGDGKDNDCDGDTDEGC
jgi:hypothetical protein